MVIDRLVVAMLESRLHTLLQRSLTALRIVGRKSGKSFVLPAQFAYTADMTMVIYPSGYQNKKWWRNLRTPTGLEILIERTWTRALGRALSPTSAGYPVARDAYRRRWPRTRIDPDAPLVTISLTLDE